jgi:hypothetical protein
MKVVNLFIRKTLPTKNQKKMSATLKNMFIHVNAHTKINFKDVLKGK